MNQRDANTMSDSQVSAMLDQSTAPRVTKEQLAALIVSEDYHRWAGTMLITCVLTLKNGFTVSGESACAAAENFKEEVGQSIARRNAVDKMWSLEGYLLRDKLAMLEGTPAASGRMALINPPAQTYIGTKVVRATPMTRAAYNILRDWQLPDNEDGADEGYLVEYADGGSTNVPGFTGYISWSPRDVFEGSYNVGVTIRETTFVQRMESELEVLTSKLDKLTVFLKSAAFQALHRNEQRDLQEQRHHMSDYAYFLHRRIQRQAGNIQ